MATPLYGLTNKEAKFDWSTECQEEFDNLLHAEEKLVTLHVFTPGNPIKLTTDASNVAVGAVLWHNLIMPGTQFCTSRKLLTRHNAIGV